MPKMGVEVTWLDGSDLRQWEEATRKPCRFSIIETPSNPLLDAVDIRAVADLVHNAGGELIVSPNFNPAVVAEAVRLGMVCLPGVMTASEAFAALAAGASGLKIFPAEMVTPMVLKALRAVLPAETLVLPVGSISPLNMPAFRAAGANGFGIGSALFKPGMTPAQVGESAAGFKAAWAGTMRA